MSVCSSDGRVKALGAGSAALWSQCATISKPNIAAQSAVPGALCAGRRSSVWWGSRAGHGTLGCASSIHEYSLERQQTQRAVSASAGWHKRAEYAMPRQAACAGRRAAPWSHSSLLQRFERAQYAFAAVCQHPRPQPRTVRLPQARNAAQRALAQCSEHTMTGANAYTYAR